MWQYLITAFLPDLLMLTIEAIPDAPREAEHASHDVEDTQGLARKTGFEDPVYKRNLERLIERNRKFEEAKE